MNILFFFLLLLYLNNSIEKESKYIELDIDCEKFCTIPVSFGSNDEVFTLQLDTTTSDSWIPSTKFDLDVPQYNILNSKNGKRTNKTIEIEDEEGIIYGKLSFDSINLENIYIKNYSFVLAYAHDNYFKDYPKGKLGLGLDVHFQFVKQLKENNYIEKEIFLIDKISKKLVIGKIP